MRLCNLQEAGFASNGLQQQPMPAKSSENKIDQIWALIDGNIK
jgi:hypothetical protein